MPKRGTSLIGPDPERAAHCAEILKSVAHPLRLRIVAILCDGEAHVTALAERLGGSQAIVSQQLRILRSHGLVGATRVNGFAIYRLLEPNLPDLVNCVDRCGRLEGGRNAPTRNRTAADSAKREVAPAGSITRVRASPAAK